MDNYIVRTTEDLLSDDIYGEVFFDCTEKIIPAILDRAMRRITAFNVSEENPYYTSYEGILYSKDGKKVIKSPAKKSGSVKLHDGTEDICENAFAFSDIQSVTFPDSLKRIERSAFDSCYALTEIDFGNGIEHLGENEDGYIFNSCDSLEVLRFPKQLKSIGKSAFANSGVRAIAFNEGLESIATRAFYGSHLEKVELPASLKNCGSLCFSTVQRVIFNGDTLPKGFISAITLDEFDSNDGVEAVKVYLKDIPSNARNICKDLQRLSNVKEVKVDRLNRLYIIPSWNKINKVCLTSKEYMGFSNLTDMPDIKEIDIEDNPYFKSIDGMIYTKDGESLVLCPSGRTKKVVIADGTKSIETSAFKDSKVKSVICPDSLQNICCLAFNECPKLQHVDFGKGITILGGMQRPVFHKCDSLKNVEFPSQIKYIGKNLFSRCFNLSKIIFHEGLERIGPNAFSSCKNVDTVKFPASLTYVGDGNFQQVSHFVFKKDRLPKNFLRAVTTFEEFVYGTRNIFEVDTPNIKFYIPSYMNSPDIAKADFYMSSYNIDYEYAASLLNVASHYGQKEDIALKMYIHFAKNGITIPAELSLFLSMSGSGIAKRLAGDKNRINEFVWMLKSKFVNDNDLQWILNGIRDDAVLTAYALDAIKERKTEDFHI